jgi:glycerophosphoryl diester phosphodiesterase
LPSHIPTIAELFENCGTDYELSIDIKDPRAMRPTVATARLAHFDESRLWLCHPDFALLQQHRRDLRDVRLVDSTRLAKIKEGPERRLATLREIGIDCINMHHTDWNGGLTTLAHKFGRFAFAWDLQHEETLGASLRMGVDAVYSDYTDRMVDVARRLETT